MLGPENPFGPSWSMEMTVPGVFPIKTQFIKLWKLCFFMLPGSWLCSRRIVVYIFADVNCCWINNVDLTNLLREPRPVHTSPGGANSMKLWVSKSHIEMVLKIHNDDISFCQLWIRGVYQLCFIFVKNYFTGYQAPISFANYVSLFSNFVSDTFVSWIALHMFTNFVSKLPYKEWNKIGV